MTLAQEAPATAVWPQVTKDTAKEASASQLVAKTIAHYQHRPLGWNWKWMLEARVLYNELWSRIFGHEHETHQWLRSAYHDAYMHLADAMDRMEGRTG